MLQALDRLRAEGIRYQQTSNFQIKVGPYNFYPGKGTIFMDREVEARVERGLNGFINIVSKLRDRKPLAASNDRRTDPRSSHHIDATVINLKD
jgi:hypothetical protein